jgi:hypothetical protein
MNRLRVLAALFFAWIGLLAATAIEALVRFSTPGLSRSLALAVGKGIFSAVGRAELLLFSIAALIAVRRAPRIVRLLLLGIGAVLVFQVAWLYPTLADRADLVMQGRNLPRSPAHTLYLVSELAKLVMLAVAGWATIRTVPPSR